MKKQKQQPLYPGIAEAEKQRTKGRRDPLDEMPDFIGGAPNYEKFKGWEPERVLAHLNID